MELHEYVFNIRGREAIELVGLGDIHFGTQSFDEKKFMEIVNWIKKRPNCYWVGLGDYTELITYRDLRRFEPANIDNRYKISDLQDWLVTQTTDLTKLLQPIANRCIGLALGNHEYDALKMYDYNATQRLCENLRVKNMGWTCLTRLIFRNRANNAVTLTLLTEHSNLAGRKKGSKINRIEDRASDFDCDIILWGHSHDKVASTKTVLYIPKKGRLKLLQRKIVCGIVPSFYRTYELGTLSYGERRGYSPTSMGIILITIKPFVGRERNTEIHISQ